jgi:hypothetical protein
MSTQTSTSRGHDSRITPSLFSPFQWAQLCRRASRQTLTLVGTGLAVTWAALVIATVPGHLSSLLWAAAPLGIAATSLLFSNSRSEVKWVRRRVKQRRNRSTDQRPAPQEIPPPVAQFSTQRALTGPHQDFVPLASYWLDPPHVKELTAFVSMIDEVCFQLRKTLGYVFGNDMSESISLQQLDVAAAGLGIWERTDSLLWRRCLRLRRDIMSEGSVPVSADQLAEHTRCLNQLSDKLRQRETTASSIPDH